MVCDLQGQGGGGPCRSDLRARPREEEGAARISGNCQGDGIREEEDAVASLRAAQGGGGAGPRLATGSGRRRNRSGTGKTYLVSLASMAIRLIIEREMPRSARSRSDRACSSLKVER